MGRLRSLIVDAGIALALLVGVANAQEKGLSEGHPVKLGDAFYVATGDAAFLVAAGVTVPRHGPPHAVFPVEFQYGLLPRTQLSVGTTVTSDPTGVADPRTGDIATGIRVSFGRETWVVPNLAAQLGVTLPTGIASRSLGVELKGYATKSLDRVGLPLFAHLNAASEVVATGTARDERQWRYHLAAGLSLTVPQHATTLLVADVFQDQAVRHGDTDTTGVEVGVRQRVTSALVFEAGVGTEAVGPRDRAQFFATLGFTFGFELPTFGGRR